MDQKHSQRWPSPLPAYSTNGHSNEVERRLTVLELSDQTQRTFNTKVKKRLFWIEKVLQLFAGVLYMLVNGKIHGDWVPSIAELLIKIMRMGP